ncbi:MAG: response regulator [Bacteroidota bacterium]|nr:response regulator [Bacteroidota bacterium]
MESLNFMVVEDEAIVAMDIKNKVLDLNHNVVATVSSGEEAIEKLKNHRIDFVILDIGLRGKIDGIQLADYIYTNYRIPFLYITAHSDRFTFLKALKTNPYAYIIKPYIERDLLISIELAIQKFYSEQEKIK